MLLELADQVDPDAVIKKSSAAHNIALFTVQYAEYARSMGDQLPGQATAELMKQWKFWQDQFLT